jgi:hypothetical protein
VFQNKQVAKDVGEAVTKVAIKKGVPASKAREMGRQAAAIKEASLNKWTRQNVGLD